MDKELEKAGGLENINGVVIDLRNNPGGLLSQAIRVSDAFLEKGEIVSTRGRNPEDGDRYNATPGDLIDGKPIVVLINGGSASASEIVAAALKITGEGSLSEQKLWQGFCSNSHAFTGAKCDEATTARYYSPSGRSIQNLGVTPDIIVEQPRRRANDEEETGFQFRSEADLRGHFLMTVYRRMKFNRSKKTEPKRKKPLNFEMPTISLPMR